MHNSARLMKGADRCTALHPADAGARGLDRGDQIRVVSRVGAIVLPLEVGDEIRPGVVSVPHGFGHVRPGVGWRLAAEKAERERQRHHRPVGRRRDYGQCRLQRGAVRVEAA